MREVNNKAFTLIELLAVIVILAIIALIATPIILGIIKDAKHESNKRSIEGYAKAIENAIVKYQFKQNETVEGKYTSNVDGTVLSQINKKDLIIEYDGNVVCSKIQIYEDGNIYLDVCKVNDELVEYTYGTKQYYENGEIVYYDVVNGVGCTQYDYHEDNSKTGYTGKNGKKTQSSCLKFYAFLDDGSSKINLLLDHNIGFGTKLCSTSLCENGLNSILTALRNYTLGWSENILEPNISYGYPIDYSGYKARIITGQEIAIITGADKAIQWDEKLKVSGNYYFETLNSSYSDNCTDNNDETICKYAWLYDRLGGCKNYGCYYNDSTTISPSSYWTSSLVENGYAWEVGTRGLIGLSNVTNSGGGIRPVIEVLKSSLKN